MAAIGGPGFCVIASDTRLCAGYSILTRNQSKLFDLTGSTVLGKKNEMIHVDKFMGSVRF